MNAAAEVAAMKARHVPRDSFGDQWCDLCKGLYPCHAARLIAFTEGVLALTDCACEYSAALDSFTEAPGCQHGIWHVEDLAALAEQHLGGQS